MRLSFSDARSTMVESQIRPFGVKNDRVLAAFAATPREVFVPESLQGLAYTGEDLNLGEGRFLMDPATYARLLQEADLPPHAHVLDIGCLYGYSSALLSELVANVVAVDNASLIKQAEANAQRMGVEDVTFVSNDLVKGAPAKGPYDAIFINGAIQQMPLALVEQLKQGGVLATFRRDASGPALCSGQAVIYRKNGDVLEPHIAFDALVPILPGFEKQEAFVF